MNSFKNKIISKFQSLNEYIKYLEDLQKVNKKKFLEDYHSFGLAEHYLHLSIEVLLDVGKILIIGCRFDRPEEPERIFDILYENHVVSRSLHEKIVGISGFRNILIHEYENVDKNLLYIYLQKEIDQFKEFKRQVLKFLKKTG